MMRVRDGGRRHICVDDTLLMHALLACIASAGTTRSRGRYAMMMSVMMKNNDDDTAEFPDMRKHYLPSYALSSFFYISTGHRSIVYQGTRPCPYRTSNRTNFKRLTHSLLALDNSTASLKGKAIDIQLSKSRWHSHATSYSPIG